MKSVKKVDKNKMHKEHIAQLHTFIKGLIDLNHMSVNTTTPLTIISRDEVTRMDIMKHKTHVVDNWFILFIYEAEKVIKTSLSNWNFLSTLRIKVDKCQKEVR